VRRILSLLLLVPSLALAALEKAPAPAASPPPTPTSTTGGPKKLSLAFTGDNGGEIAPCG
jgi:hypothetical protein